MKDTNQAQHYIGKLLRYLGPDNIVWGTDCILSGSPQAADRGLPGLHDHRSSTRRCTNIPPITDDMKRKIFGLNAAKIYHIDPTAARCKVEASSFAMLKRELDNELGPRRWAVKPPLGPRTAKEFFALAREHRAKGLPG